MPCPIGYEATIDRLTEENNQLRRWLAGILAVADDRVPDDARRYFAERLALTDVPAELAKIDAQVRKANDVLLAAQKRHDKVVSPLAKRQQELYRMAAAATLRKHPSEEGK